MVYVKYKNKTYIGVVKILVQCMKFLGMTLKFRVWCAVNAHIFTKAVCFEVTDCS